MVGIFCPFIIESQSRGVKWLIIFAYGLPVGIPGKGVTALPEAACGATGCVGASGEGVTAAGAPPNKGDCLGSN